MTSFLRLGQCLRSQHGIYRYATGKQSQETAWLARDTATANVRIIAAYHNSI
ncbi:hypothetical protein BDV37DRAFT_237056 [Aspergillus pseudonomiae]|uniref:Uncharacterized protein n=1 Tax=Aspergillus pseudonomiae TaxID=1506151 RepID=A0A5N7DS09_9EURO|nr:uncharacterized protein BDV37DRAFT_237056 [Aspergillus pseudonomiae]KAE8409250.1 hypothetical protein BDV37DRAFT_237056 [Aspergillus pseudonomiae]